MDEEKGAENKQNSEEENDPEGSSREDVNDPREKEKKRKEQVVGDEIQNSQSESHLGSEEMEETVSVNDKGKCFK